MLLDNTLDCMVRAGSGLFGGLSAITLVQTVRDDEQETLHFVCRNGLVNCRQSKAIVDELNRCLNCTSTQTKPSS